MKGTRFQKRAAIALLAVAGLVRVNAAVVTLTDNNSVAQIDPNSTAGMFNWSVSGQNQLNQQWFWFRVGSANAEQGINTISAPTITTPNARTAYIDYNNGSFGVSIAYLLTGFTPGISNQFSDISESISITNGTASPLEFHFFQYSDFNLGGSTGGQIIDLGKNLRGLFNEASQQSLGVALTETVVTPGAQHGEAALFNTTLAKLTNGSADNLNDNISAGPGNATWALQWDFVIAPYSSVGIAKDKYLAIAAIPEPSAAAFIGLGFLALAMARRRNNS